MKISYKSLAVIAYLTSLNPFFSIFPIRTDLQPLYLFPIIFYFITTKKISLSFREIYLLLFSIFYLFYFNRVDGKYEIMKMFTPLMAFGSYYYFKRNSKFLNQKILFYVITINLSICILQYLFPEATSKIIFYFVRTVIITDPSIGVRGSSGLSAEPGFMGTLGVTYLILSIYLRDFKNKFNYFKINILFSFCIILGTKSGTAALLIITFFTLYFFFSFRKKMIILPIIVSLIFVILFAEISFGRFSSTIFQIFNNPYSLFFKDESVAHRVLGIFVGLFTLIENPIGFGAGSYIAVAKMFKSNYEFFELVNSQSFGAVSVFGKFLTEVGIFYLFLLFIIFFKKNFFKAVPYYSVAFLTILGGFSFAFPPVWLIAALDYEKLHDGNEVINYVTVQQEGSGGELKG